ncbi:hypothetical protein D3C73_1506020 [compost metagenome]
MQFLGTTSLHIAKQGKLGGGATCALHRTAPALLHRVFGKRDEAQGVAVILRLLAIGDIFHNVEGDCLVKERFDLVQRGQIRSLGLALHIHADGLRYRVEAFIKLRLVSAH